MLLAEFGRNKDILEEKKKKINDILKQQSQSFSVTTVTVSEKRNNKAAVIEVIDHSSLALPSTSGPLFSALSSSIGHGPSGSILRGSAAMPTGSSMDRSTDGLGRASRYDSDAEAAAYKRRLESYRQAQHQQALLVARLQSKLLQYKQRCSDLETKLGQSPEQEPTQYYFGSLGSGGRELGGRNMNDLEDSLWKLEQERVRNDSLLQLNRDLRGELDETRKINNALSSDLQKLSDEWDKLSRQMGDRESQWKYEEQQFSDYYASEHSKLLSLWKKVSATKREYSELKSTTGRDLAQLKNSLAKISNQISSGVLTAAITSPTVNRDTEHAAFMNRLTQELSQAQTSHENMRRQLKERDDKITNLETSIREIDGKSQSLELELNRITGHELGLLQNSLREIGKLLLSDFDGLDDGHGHDLHLSSTPAIFLNDNENGENPTIFAESIVSAVQAALNKRQLQIHQLQVNLQAQKEQSMVTRGHIESLETDHGKAEEKISALTDANEKFKEILETLKMERDSAQRGLDNLKNEKNILDQHRKALTSELEALLKIKASQAANLSKFEKIAENSRLEIDHLSNELDKTRDELSTKSNQLNIEQELNMKIREQLNNISEDREKHLFENKNMKNSLNELTARYDDLFFQFERSEDSLKKCKMDLEIISEKLRIMSDRSEVAEKEKKKWMEKARIIEETKSTLESELTDTRNDLASLRREILEGERIKTDLETKLEAATSRADQAENKKSILENQLDAQREEYHREFSLMNERTELINEELNNVRRDFDETIGILERTRADLQNSERLHMDAIHLIEAKENDVKNISNQLEKLRNEKCSLEELEDTLKRTLIDKDRKIESLEKHTFDLKNKLASELGILKEKLKRSENEAKNIKEKYDQEKAILEAKFNKDVLEIKTSAAANEEKTRTDCEEAIKNIRNESENEKKVDMIKLNVDNNSLRSQIESLRVQYEEALLRAENDKQQGLLLAQQDQQGLSEKIQIKERELEDLKNEKDRVKRECEVKCNQEKMNSGSLRSELNKIKNELENTRRESTETLKNIETRLRELEKEKEEALLQIEDFKGKMKSMEEKEGDLKRELGEVNRKLKDSENSGENSKRDLNEMRKTLGEMAIEKEKNNSIMENMKEEINSKENNLMMIKKDMNKSQARIKELERLKSEFETEINNLAIKLEEYSRDRVDANRQFEEISDQLSQAKGNNSKLESEVTELKMKLDAETERRDDAESQWRNAKKMFEEAESNLSIIKNEEERLALRLAEAEERYSVRESQLIGMAEDNKIREKKLMEEKHNLSISLMNLQQNMEQVTNKYNSVENRLRNISEEKAQHERLKKEAESKIAQVHSGLKRLGINTALDSSDGVRRALATLQTQMASIQQDRDSLSSQLNATRETLSNLEIGKSNMEDHLGNLARSLQNARSDCKVKETQVYNLEKEVALKIGELKRYTDKSQELEDQIKSKDEQNKIIRNEKDLMKDELDKARQKLDDSRQSWDSRWAKTEVNLRSLEGDLNRMSLVLQQKESHITTLEEKCSMIAKNNAELEERCSNTTVLVEQLKISLDKSENNCYDLKEKLSIQGRTSSENSNVMNQLKENIRALQREKSQLDQERNNLNDKWEIATAGLQDFKRQVQILSDKNQKLRLQTEEMTRNAIEKQLKISFAESGKEDLRQLVGEKMELTRKLEGFYERVKDLERENRELERLKDSIPLKGIKSVPFIAKDNVISQLEEENSEQRRKVAKYESEIRDLERSHIKHIGEVTAQVKQERDFDLERAKAAKLQAERLLEARETNYRQQIHRLEQQVSTLKDQLSEEIRRRQSFLSRSFRTGQEVKSLRQALGDSLKNVSLDPNVIESETRRLNRDLVECVSPSSPMRDPRDPSPSSARSRTQQSYGK